MFALIRLMLAYGALGAQSSDVACVDQPDRYGCAESVCRVASGIDFDVNECDGLAEHLRAVGLPYWRVVDLANDCAVY